MWIYYKYIVCLIVWKIYPKSIGRSSFGKMNSVPKKNVAFCDALVETKNMNLDSSSSSSSSSGMSTCSVMRQQIETCLYNSELHTYSCSKLASLFRSQCTTK